MANDFTRQPHVRVLAESSTAGTRCLTQGISFRSSAFRWMMRLYGYSCFIETLHLPLDTVSWGLNFDNFNSDLSKRRNSSWPCNFKLNGLETNAVSSSSGCGTSEERVKAALYGLLVLFHRKQSSYLNSCHLWSMTPHDAWLRFFFHYGPTLLWISGYCSQLPADQFSVHRASD